MKVKVGNYVPSAECDLRINVHFGERITCAETDTVLELPDGSTITLKATGESVRHEHDKADPAIGYMLAVGDLLTQAGRALRRMGWNEVKEADAAKEAKAGIDAILDAAKVHEHVGAVTGTRLHTHVINVHGFNLIELASASDDDLKVIHRTAHFPDPEARYTTVEPLSPEDLHQIAEGLIELGRSA